MTLETKTLGAADIEDVSRAFAAFRETNDERLAEIETRLAADVVTEEKLARIDRALDDAKRRLDRLALDAGRPARICPAIRCSRSTRAPSTSMSAPARRRG